MPTIIGVSFRFGRFIQLHFSTFKTFLLASRHGFDVHFKHAS